jgi:hypothetical protein
LATCKAKCTAARERCGWFTFDTDLTATPCILYKGPCAAGGAGESATSANTYEKKPMCYWTDPLLIFTDKKCDNGVALNGSSEDEFPVIATGTTSLSLKRPF